VLAATLALSSAGGPLSQPPQSQIKALLALWKSTSGKDWTATWPITDGVINVGSENPCAGGWTGVACNEIGDTIAEVLLVGQKMDGVIPRQISVLKDLEFLNVGNNPALNFNQPAIGKLTKLRSLVFSGSRGALSSKVPDYLSSLVSLEILGMSRTNLYGPVPVGFSKLLKLTFLDISNNRISGKIPQKLSVLADKGPGALQFVWICSNDVTLKVPSAWSLASGVSVSVEPGSCDY